jgi:hypothetical protein
MEQSRPSRTGAIAQNPKAAKSPHRSTYATTCTASNA